MPNRIEVEAMEPRVLLSSSINVDGLPRQMTQVGNTLYFAVDTKRDGHLTYGDLLAFSPKTGKQQSIRRDDGKPFGANQFYLFERNGCLIIDEDYKDASNNRMEWVVRPGETRAQRLTKDPQFAIENEVVVGDRTFFTILADRHSTFMVARAGKQGESFLDVNTLTGGDFVNGAIAYEDKVVFTTESFQTGKGRLYVTDGTAKGTRRISVPIDGSFRPQDLGVVGKKLVFNVTDGSDDTLTDPQGFRVFQMDGLASTPREYVPTVRQESARVTAYAGGRAFINSKAVNGGYLPIYTGLTAKTTTHIADAVGDNMIVAGNSAYVSDGYAPRPFDPESVGGYVAPNSSSGSVTQIISGYAQVLRRIDLSDGSTTELLSSTTMSAGSLVAIGGTVFFSAQDSIATDYDRTKAQLWRTDGTRLGTTKVSDMFAGPFAFDGKIYSTNAYDAKTITTTTAPRGAIAGHVVRDDTHAKSFADARGMEGFTVWLDLDHDGQRDDKEPSQRTGTDGAYRFGDLKDGSYDVGIDGVGRWAPTRQVMRTVAVSTSNTKSIDFGLADDRKDARISGKLSGPLIRYGSEFTTPALVALKKYDGNGNSTTIQTVTLNSSLTFSFKHLIDGVYWIDVLDASYPDGNAYRSSPAFHVTISSTKKTTIAME